VISNDYGFEIDTLEMPEDHIHTFLSIPLMVRFYLNGGLLTSANQYGPAIDEDLLSLQRQGYLATFTDFSGR
jgi:REP element-mobilizing transposase RayT